MWYLRMLPDGAMGGEDWLRAEEPFFDRTRAMDFLLCMESKLCMRRRRSRKPLISVSSAGSKCWAERLGGGVW